MAYYRVESERPFAQRGGPQFGVQDRGTGDLVRELVAQGQRLIQEEIRLAKAEFKDEAKVASKGGAFIGAGGALGLVGLIVLSFCAVYALGTAMPLWAGALIVGVVLAIAAAICVSVGKKRLSPSRLQPGKETLQTLGEDKQWAKETMQSARSRTPASA